MVSLILPNQEMPMVWYELIEEVWLKLGTLAIDDIRTLYHVCKLPIETQH